MSRVMTMGRGATRTVQRALKALGIGVTRYETLERLRNSARCAQDLDFLRAMPRHQAFDLLQQLPFSKAQLRQDLFVLSELEFRTGGFFVEFGATNGVDLSNTHLLEHRFGWNGILAEPARRWREALQKNRSCDIVFDCVWSTTGESLRFIEPGNPELSTVARYRDRDMHADSRRRGSQYSVRTISLTDLLDQHGAPRRIDYLSIDTEGSEYEILAAVDFDVYRFSVITCEHNYTGDRDRIHALLTRNGYRRRLEQVSAFDDWYVSTEWV